MRFRIEFSAKAERDFALIFDHLFESYLRFGESVEAALDHSEARIHVILQEADRLAEAAFCGESHDDLAPGMRQRPIDRAIYWFEGNEAEKRARVFAIGLDSVSGRAVRALKSSAEIYRMLCLGALPALIIVFLSIPGRQ